MPDLGSLSARMSRLKYFKDLSASELSQVIRAGHIRAMPEGTIIVSEDTPCAGLFVLLTGVVYLYRTSPDGQAVLLDELSAVTMFNEVAVLDGGPNAMTVIAAQNCRVWQAEYPTVTALADRFPQVALGFLPVLARRTRVLISMVTDVCFRSVRARTAKLILELSIGGTQPISRQDNSIQKMAAQISAAPEAVSRSLSYFRDQDCICTSRATIMVCDAEKLAALADLDCDPEPA